MMPELGNLALVMALLVSLVQGVLPLVGAERGHAAWMAVARPAAWAQCAMVVVAYAVLTHAFVTHDFSVRYVAQHSNTALPLAYRVSAVWGGHEGSILLWSLILAGWTLAVATFSRHLPAPMVARILAVMGLISSGFLLFTLFTSNPFTRLLPAVADGQDLNPLLQDPGMVLHPPLLYMGYVGFSVAFAFAVAALLAGQLDSAWARWSRPWTTVAWSFLSLGIALGSAWAYYELGWGGWWFWDPVENASFLPWLVGTALIHSLAVTEKRGGFKMWTALLAILAFSLSLLGTFLVRSGVLSSVHAFSTDPSRGIFILGFLVVVVGGSLSLFAWRGPRVGIGGSFGGASRESLLLTNNVVLLVATAAVLLGTLYPLAVDALGWGKLSVGPAYFETVFVPLVAPALFLMGVGPLARWKHTALPELAHRLRWAGGVSVVTAVVSPLVFGHWTPMIGFGLLMALWIATSTLTSLVSTLRGHPLMDWPRRLALQSGSHYGMLLAHLGVAVFVAGVTLVRGFESESDLRMAIGDTTTAGGYTFRLDRLREVQGPNYTGARATLSVEKNGHVVAVLEPEKRFYTVSRTPMTEVAIDRGITRDLYVSLGAPLDANAWSVRVHHKPFINWIWGGCVFMAFGGLLAVSDRRYRIRKKAQVAADAGPRVGALAPEGSR